MIDWPTAQADPEVCEIRNRNQQAMCEALLEGLCPWCEARTLEELTSFGMAHDAYVLCHRCQRMFKMRPWAGGLYLEVNEFRREASYEQALRANRCLLVYA